MPHAKSKGKPDNSIPKSLQPLTVYYTNVRGLRGNFTDLEAFCSRTTLASLLSVKPTCMATCQSIARMLGICTSLVFMLRAIFRLLKRFFLRMKMSLICFRLALLHSTTFIFFLYHSPSCSVVEAVSSNIGPYSPTLC